MYELESFRRWLEADSDYQRQLNSLGFAQRESVTNELKIWTRKSHQDWVDFVFQTKEVSWWDPISFPHKTALKRWAIEQEQQFNCEGCPRMRSRINDLKTERDKLKRVEKELAVQQTELKNQVKKKLTEWVKLVREREIKEPKKGWFW